MVPLYERRDRLGGGRENPAEGGGSLRWLGTAGGGKGTSGTGSASGSSAPWERSTSSSRSCGRSPEPGDERGLAVIPNVTRGGKTHGVLAYLVGKGKREEHTDPHLVAGSPEAFLRCGGRELERG